MTDFSANYIPQYRTSTLDKAGGLNDSATTGIKTNTIPADLDITKPGIVAITWSNPIVTADIEWMSYTSIDGTNEFQGVTRGAEGWTAKSHLDGATIAWVVSKSHVNEIMDALKGVKSGVTLSSPTLTTPQINDTSSNHQYVVAPSELSADRTVTLPLLTGADEFTFNAHTQTLTNKKITKRVTTATSYTTDTGTSLNCDTTDIFIVTAQAGALKFNNPSGTPTSGQLLQLSVTGTAARALTYDTQFESSAGATLPTTTVTTARIDILVQWRSDTSKWHCLAAV